MEHLFFAPRQDDLERQMSQMLSKSPLSSDWNNPSDLGQAISWKTYEYLGFYHSVRPQKDCVSFSSYPSIRGWHILASDIDKLSSLSEHTTRQEIAPQTPTMVGAEDGPYSIDDFSLAGMLQSWLTFGFLEDVCNVAIDVNFLVRPEPSGTPVVDTRNLTFLLYAQKHRLSQMPEEQRYEELSRIGQTVQAHQKVIESLVACLNEIMDSSNEEADDITAADEYFLELVDGALVVATLVAEAEIHACNQTRHPEKKYEISTSETLPELVPREELVEAGFCPTFIEQQKFRSYTAWHWLVWWGNVSGIPKLEIHSECDSTTCALETTPDRGRSPAMLVETRYLPNFSDSWRCHNC